MKKLFFIFHFSTSPAARRKLRTPLALLAGKLKLISFACLSFSFFILPVFAASFPRQNEPGVMTKSGLIQNVQNYSSNPFYDPNGPYNQRMPTPVYATGTDLNATECQSVVTMFVANECARQNNCQGVQLTDIRPNVITQLSQLSGHNYVISCAGYIDAAFNDYKSSHLGAVTTTGFPTAVNPGSNIQGADYTIPNPYQHKNPKWADDYWYDDIFDRIDELEELQSQNGGGNESLARADFPATYADLSFTERMDNAAAGYEKWAGTSAYSGLKVESDETRYMREQAIAQMRQTTCMTKYPNAQYLEGDLQALYACKNAGKTLQDCNGLSGMRY